MANRAYASVWTRGFSEPVMLEQFEALLGTIPFSQPSPGLTSLTVRAVEPTQPPLVEHDARLEPVTIAELLEVLREYAQNDTSIETEAHWDLWTYDPELLRCELRPQRLLLTCFAEAYDDGAFAEMGHFHADLGFEHFFTGHAGLLGLRRHDSAPPQHPAEAAFLRAMSQPAILREYREKTLENIRKLLDWMQRIHAALPVERNLLWSEGEENFEARIDDILAAR
jgi:hypothetical protein